MIAISISATSVLSKAWTLLQDKYPIILSILLWHAVRNIVITAVILYMTLSNALGPLITFSAAALLGILSYIEFLHFALKLVRKEPLNLFNLPGLSVLTNWLIAVLLTTLSVWLGTIALVIPGLALGVFFSTNGYAVADGLGPIQSIKLSWRIARSAFWQVVLVFLILLILAAIFPLCTIFIDMMLIFSLAFLYNANPATLESAGVKQRD